MCKKRLGKRLRVDKRILTLNRDVREKLNVHKGKGKGKLVEEEVDGGGKMRQSRKARGKGRRSW